jgi:hypothetical protein
LEKLRPIEEATILEMAAAGKSQTEIADAVCCHQTTVSRTLAEWTDSRDVALKFVKAIVDQAPSDSLHVALGPSLTSTARGQ